MKPIRTIRRPRPAPSGPIGGLEDRRFRYIPAVATDIRKTYDRIREQQKKGQTL